MEVDQEHKKGVRLIPRFWESRLANVNPIMAGELCMGQLSPHSRGAQELNLDRAFWSHSCK